MHPILQRFLAELGRPLVVIDLETTTHAPSAPNFGITEVSLTRFEPTGEVSQFSHLVNPENEMTPQAQAITGLDPAELAQQPNFGQLLPEFGGFLNDAVLCGFNIRGFDIPALLQEVSRYGLAAPEAIDLLDLRDVWVASGLTENGKGTLTAVADYFGVEKGLAHRADGDVQTCLNLLPEMIWAFGKNAMFAQGKEYFTAKQEAEQRRTQTAGPGNYRNRTPEDRQAQEAKVDQIVTTFAQANAVIEVQAVVDQHRAAKISAFDVSQSIGRLIDAGAITSSQVWDQASADWAAANFHTVLDACGGPSSKLKPLYEKAKEMGAPASFDYVQVRVALLPYKDQRQAAPRRGPGM